MNTFTSLYPSKHNTPNPGTCSTVSPNDLLLGYPKWPGDHCHNPSKPSVFSEILGVRIFFLKLQLNLSLHNFYLQVLSQNITNVFVCLGCISSVSLKELEHDGVQSPHHPIVFLPAFQFLS